MGFFRHEFEEFSIGDPDDCLFLIVARKKKEGIEERERKRKKFV